MPRSNNPNGGGDQPPGQRRWRVVLQMLIALLSLINALFFALLLRPAGEQARLQRQTFDSLRSELQSSRESIGRLRSVSQNIGEARREDLSFYQEKFLPKPTGFSIIMEQVDKIALDNKVRKGAVNYTLADVLGRPDLNQVEITTALEGDYGNIVRFINSVERSSLFLIIDSISVAGGPAVAGQPRMVRLSLRLVTFFKV